jgi:TolB-like protein/DNA-binding winged helix-turn-helix (wHTH) protein/Flp pilus assembly protein TadD
MRNARGSRRVRFGAFEADLCSCELFKRGIRIKIQDQPFQILAILIERQGELVSREELRKRLWPSDTFVDFDAGLNAAIRRLRDALNDSTDKPRYVETLPRHGYRFIAPVETSTAPALAKLDTRGLESARMRSVIDNGQRSVQPEPSLQVLERRESAATKRKWRRTLAVAALTVLIAGVSAAGWRSRVLSKHASPTIRSIAVLPLQNLTGDPNRDFFVDGMTETLATELAQIHSLRVSSRTSSSRFKHANLSSEEIARQLNVDALLEGAVLESRSRVRITVQLIQAHSNKHLWAKQYDREPVDILNLQREIAQAVAAEIPLNLQPAEEYRLRANRPVNPQAYEAYLEGQYLWKKRTVKSLHRSIEYFQRSVESDPNWGSGYAGLAESYAMLGYGVMVELPPDEAARNARAFAMKAIDLDASLAAPHAVLGLIKHRHDWDWAGAAAEFEKAIDLDPSYVTAHYWYGTFFMTQSRLDEERRELGIARHLDPTYPFIQSNYGSNLDATGRHEEALAAFRQAINLDETNWVPHYDLGGSYERFRQYDDAIREFSRVLEISDGNLRIKGDLARLYALQGRQAEARSMIAEIRGKPNSAFSIAEVYVALGENKQALAYLKEAMNERCGWIVFMKVRTTLDPLRSEAAFQGMIRQIGFPTL